MNDALQIPMAVLGTGCYVPGAQNTEQFWSLLKNGQYAVSKIPPERLNREWYFDPKKGVPGKTYCELAGLVDRLEYDPLLHPFPNRLGEFIDTVPLMLCRAAADAMRQAHLDPFCLNRPNWGVYVGCNASGTRIGQQQYGLFAGRAGELLAELPNFQELAGTHSDAIIRKTVEGVRSQISSEDLHPSRMTTAHIIANGMSEAFDLTGPSIVLDATCSSSLKALAIAQRDLTLGKADMALVGGAYSFTLDPLLQFGMSQAATNNRSCPFSDNADGIVIAEAYIVLLLKPLDRAIAEGDSIQSVVRSIGISADGKGKGTWAPRKEGQVEAIRRAYPNEADMQRLVYLEAHATSTPVGDMTEMEALTEAFAGKMTQKIPMGSVKANLGHSLEAAGLTGLVKAMLVLQHGIVPRQIHCETLNTQIDWDALPLFVSQHETTLASCPNKKPRLAAINAFGIGGINAHAVIEEATDALRSQNRSTAMRVSAWDAQSSKSSSEPIAIIGYGVLFPDAKTIGAFRDMVCSVRKAISPVPEDRWYHGNRYPILPQDREKQIHLSQRVGGFVQNFDYNWRKHRISPKQIAKANPLLFMLLDSVDAALADAGYQEKEPAAQEESSPRKKFDRARTEVIVGTNFETDFFPELLMAGRIPHFMHEMKKAFRHYRLSGEKQIEDAANTNTFNTFAEQLRAKMPAFFDELGSFTPSGLASRLAKILDLMGGAGTIDSGNTAALAAIAQGVASLRTGASDMVICAAGARSVGLELHALESSLDQDKKRIPAEGAGTVILKRLCDAQQDDDPIHAVIHSVGTGFSSNTKEAFQMAIERAWEEVERTKKSLTPKNVEFIELASVDDNVRRSELEALSSFYQKHRNGKPFPLIDPDIFNDPGATANAAVSAGFARFSAAERFISNADLNSSIQDQIGDSMAASGMAGVIKSSIQLEQFPVDSDLANDPHCTAKEPALAAVSSYDDFGSAYHLILEQGKNLSQNKMTKNTMISKTPFPLISQCRALNENEAVAEILFDPRKDRFLLDHQLRLRPLLPGVIAAEAFAQAASCASSRAEVVAIHDLQFIEGLRFLSDDPKTAKVHVQLDGDLANGDLAKCQLMVDFCNRRGKLVKADRVHTIGTVELADVNQRLEIELPTNCPTRSWYDLCYLDPNSMMYHGDALHQLQRMVFCESDFWGECKIGSPAMLAGDRETEGWRTSPATIDACLYLGGLAFWNHFSGILGLPRSIDHLRFGRTPRPEEACLVYAKIVKADDDGMSLDFTLFGDDCEALIVGEGYYLQLVPSSKKLGSPNFCGPELG